MKATSWIIAGALAVTAVVFGVMWSKASKDSKGLANKNKQLQELYDTSSATINDIQSSLDTFDQEFASIGSAMEASGSTPSEIIANARARLDEYKQQISDLEAKLSSSRGQLSGLQNIVDQLKRSVADKERIVANLEGRVSNLSSTLDTERQTTQTEINLREEQIRDRETQIANQTRESNRLFWVAGTRKELQDNGIIDRRGGILGIGRVSTVRDADLSKYTEINLLDTTELTFPATRRGYSILSSHIAASYEVSQDGENYVLRVTDPDSFKKQKLLVIEIK